MPRELRGRRRPKGYLINQSLIDSWTIPCRRIPQRTAKTVRDTPQKAHKRCVRDTPQQFTATEQSRGARPPWVAPVGQDPSRSQARLLGGRCSAQAALIISPKELAPEDPMLCPGVLFTNQQPELLFIKTYTETNAGLLCQGQLNTPEGTTKSKL